jgi:GT2 family glycosyltransferase
MEISLNPDHHPIMQLKDDLENFLEAIDPHPGSELFVTGHRFIHQLSELHDLYVMEYHIEYIESCWQIPEFINPNPNQSKKESGQRKK